MKLRERILNSDCLGKQDVVLANWDNVTVQVRGISLAERQELVKSAKEVDGTTDLAKLYPALLQKTMYDPENEKRIFSEKDRDAIAGLDVPTIEIVAAIAMKLLGINLEELEKNSATTHLESTPSESAPVSEG